MRVTASAVDIQSQRTAAFLRTEQETLHQWRGAQNRENTASTGTAATRTLLSEAAQSLSAQMQNTAEAIQRSNESDAIDAVVADPADSDPMLSLIRAMVEILTGETIRTASSRLRTTSASDAPPPSAPPQRNIPPRESSRSPNWGMSYDYRATREEYERTDLTARGVVVTTDGARIDFRLDLSMERYHREETSVSLRAGNAVRKDPLVLNFDGTAAQLSNQRFRFDLDSDGRAENVPLLAGGSGYLALDLNGNGRIDNGKELFGPGSDSGFSDLALLDSDGNGWIDEADPAFALLRIWQPDAEGAGQLSTLQERGVGALYLGHARSPFELRGDGNTDLGAVRETGLFLFESGKTGSMQEIDLTI